MEEVKGNELARELKGIVQVGLVVADLDKVMQGMRDLFGIEPDSIIEPEFPRSTYRGEEVEATPARIANYDYFGVQIEYIQPLGEGPSIWWDYLKEGDTHGGSALHHIRFTDPDDNDRITAMMAERGVEVYQEAHSFVNPGGKATYYDTRAQIGFISELVTKTKR